MKERNEKDFSFAAKLYVLSKRRELSVDRIVNIHTEVYGQPLNRDKLLDYIKKEEQSTRR